MKVRISALRRIIAAVFVFALLAGFALGPAGRAFADPPNDNASCMGYEASDISPPGSNPEFLGGVPEVLPEFGTPPGPGISGWAQLMEGSHEACDATIPE